MSNIVQDKGNRRFRLILNILGIILSVVLLSYYVPFLRNASLTLKLAAGGILTLIVVYSLAIYIIDLAEIFHRGRTPE